MVLASGVRIGWSDLPDKVRAAVEDLLGGPVVAARSQAGGFSPGTADRVVTAAGRRAFVKAVGTSLNPESPGLHRTEAAVVAKLPAGLPTPALLGVYDDGDWIALAFEDVEGRHPHTPWQHPEIEAALAALAALDVQVQGLPRLYDETAEDFTGWRNLAADPPAAPDPWVAGHLDLLVELSAHGHAAMAGDALVHGDIRADNLLVRPDGSVLLVDWPFGCAGPAWFDALSLVLNVRLYGGHVPDSVIHAPGDDLTGCVAGLAGMFADRARRPDPPGLPTLRKFQQDQADVMLVWLRERLGF
ncbi:phosphotransferase [Dactylosporangium sp. CS-033363]|uniref:phosphotransferase n=1 Tax=Dactylosporangium sp. CS-033363 TaxID=3239935 RepID=UPI003D93A047